MPLLSYSTCVVNQLHGTGHKYTNELVTWLVTRKVWGIKSTVNTAWSCETDSQKRKPRGRRTQEQREHETAQDVSVVFTWALGKKKWALWWAPFILLHKEESGTLLCFFHSRCGTQPGLCSPGYRYHNPEHHPKLLYSTLFHPCCLFPLLLPESVRDRSV